MNFIDQASWEEAQLEQRRSNVPRYHVGGWTEERKAMLAKLWAEGLSCAQIAAAMGEGLTRNGVIGKAHRMKLPERLSTSRYANIKKRNLALVPVGRQPRKAPVKVGNGKIARTSAEIADAKAYAREQGSLRRKEVPQAAPDSAPVFLLDIGANQCRFPLWAMDAPRGTEKLFCGAPTHDGAWCEFHRSVVFKAEAA